MAGYIGKISAVVTANTSMLSRELVKSAKDANRFASALKSSIDRAADGASASIEKIFTPLQMLERKLQQAASRGLKLNMPSDKIRAFVSAAEQINKPLEQASKQFSRLGLDVQAGFLPALNLAQDAAIRVNREIQATGTASAESFARAQVAVQGVTQALGRLKQAQELSEKGLTGNELQFRRPAVFAAINASASASQKAGSLPPERLEDGVLSKRVRELDQYQQAVIEAQAKLESLELQPNVDPAVIEQQKKRVQDLAETSKRAAEALASDIEADSLRQRNAEQEKAIANGTKLLQVLSNEEAAQIRLKEQTQAATTASRIARQEKSREIDASFRSRDAFELDLDDREVNSYLQRLGVLKTTLSSLSKQESKQAEVAIRKFGLAVSKALADRSIRSSEVRAELKRIQNEATRATAAAAKIDVKELGNRLRTAGDIGRRGVDKFSLALNQAAFAVDDFFSATGGLEFKIRAVQNNLTQLGFILDSTRGLFLALGAAIVGQVVIAALKYLNVMEDTEKKQEELSVRSEVLSSAYENQKTAVDELAEAYKRLSGAADDALTKTQKDSQQFTRDIDEIKRNQEQSRSDLAARTDNVTLAARERQSAEAKRLESASSIPEQIFRRRRLREAQAAEESRVGELTKRGERLVNSGLGEDDFVRRIQKIQERLKVLRGQREFASGSGRSNLGRFDSEISRLESERAVSAQGVRLLRDRSVISAAEAFNPVASLASQLQSRAQGLDGAGFISDRIGAEAIRLQGLFNEVSSNPGSEEAQKQFTEAVGAFRSLLEGDLSVALDNLADRSERSAEALKEFEDAASRGDSIRQGLRDPGEILRQSIDDVIASFERDVLDSSGKQSDIEAIRAEQKAAIDGLLQQRFGEDAQRQAAPAVFALSDGVANAVLQGPSRQALNVSDVTTSQGTAEFLRLLRGEDPARDQNLVELRRQTEELVGLRRDFNAMGVAP